ncbi:MAG: cobalt-precorrin-6A reductase [Neomegalonema sp.]|nr:cobalt-precorrin-6A reductase [Neomegalonema sp.]
MTRLLLLGGTREARQLATELSGRPQLDVIYSLVGATTPHAPPGARLRVGGFGGADGLAEFLRVEAVDVVVNATHPFAARISANAARAAKRAGVDAVRLLRPPWFPAPGDQWRTALDLDAAATVAPSGARVFLALGRRGAAAFAARSDLWRIARVAEAGPPLAGVDRLEIGPPGDLAQEIDLFQRLRVDLLVVRNSGGSAGYEKLAAARKLDVPVLMVARPEHHGPVLSSVAAAYGWLMERLPEEARWRSPPDVV